MPQKLVSEKKMKQFLLQVKNLIQLRLPNMTSQIKAISYKQLDYDAVAIRNYARNGLGVGVQQSTPEEVWQFQQKLERIRNHSLYNT